MWMDGMGWASTLYPFRARASGRTSWGRAGSWPGTSIVTGAVPHTSSAAGRLHADLGRSSPGYCLQACPCAVSGRGGRGVWKGSRLKPLEVLSSSIARIATCARCHPEAAGFAGGYPIGPKAQRRPHSSPTRRRDHRAANHTLRSVLLGEGTVSCMPRSFAPVMSPDPVTQVCERELRTRFVPVCQGPVRSPWARWGTGVAKLNQTVDNSRRLGNIKPYG